MNTKKLSWLGLGLFVAVALASCDNIEDSLAQPITNPQEPIYNSATIVYNAVTTINASDPQGEVQVATYSAEGLPEGFTIGGTLELSPSADFAKVIDAHLTASDGTLYASLADIAAQYTDSFTKEPSTVNLYGRVKLTASDGTDVVRIGTIDTYYGESTYTFTPPTPAHIIYPAYYVVMGDGTNWDYDGAIEMTHPGDANQYDDPIFTVVVKNASEMGDKWIVLSDEGLAQAKSSGLAGVEALVPIADINGGDFEVETSGNFSGLSGISTPCELTFNAQRRTYTSKAAQEAYYATGSGWSNWSEHWMPLTTTNFIQYYGFLNLESEFKFAPQAGWGGDFGSKEPLKETDNEGIISYSGILDKESDNIKINHPGLYWACLNVETWNLSLEGINSWGIIGVIDWETDINMTQGDNLNIWTAEVTLAEGNSWKFRANGNWAINLGGSSDELWSGGSNISLPEGTYTITLDLTTYPSKFSAVKK